MDPLLQLLKSKYGLSDDAAKAMAAKIMANPTTADRFRADAYYAAPGITGEGLREAQDRRNTENFYAAPGDAAMYAGLQSAAINDQNAPNPRDVMAVATQPFSWQPPKEKPPAPQVDRTPLREVSEYEMNQLNSRARAKMLPMDVLRLAAQVATGAVIPKLPQQMDPKVAERIKAMQALQPQAMRDAQNEASFKGGTDIGANY